MDQKLIIIILVIFLLTNNFSKIFKDIIKGFIYLLLLLAVLKIINPSIEKKIKETLLSIINSEQGIFTNIFSTIAVYLKKFINTSIKDDEKNKNLDTSDNTNEDNSIINIITSFFSQPTVSD